MRILKRNTSFSREPRDYGVEKAFLFKKLHNEMMLPVLNPPLLLYALRTVRPRDPMFLRFVSKHQWRIVWNRCGDINPLGTLEYSC